MGDKGDNVPAVKEKCGIVTATKMLDGGLENELLNDSVRENYERNTKLIDLSKIPQEYQDSILESYDNFEIKKFRTGKVFSFLLKHRQKYLAENISTFSKHFEALG